MKKNKPNQLKPAQCDSGIEDAPATVKCYVWQLLDKSDRVSDRQGRNSMYVLSENIAFH